MLRTTKLIGTATLGLLLGVVGCHNDELFRPVTIQPVNALFTRYVSMGNSITAGFQSNGINDSTQVQSYANLLAGQMRTPFYMPLMSRPGCPPPYDNVYTQHRVGGGTPTTCALRKPQPVPPPYINDVAVPGAEVMDGTSNLDTASHPNPLTTFFLGGLSQAQMMQRVNPTFVTVWLGNNDVLGAATSSTNAGDTTKITDSTHFANRYKAVLDSIDATPASGKGVLIGVANVTLIPYFSRGSKFWNVQARTDSIAGSDSAGRHFPANFLVTPTCASPHGDSVLVPFPAGAARLAFARVNPGITVGVNCDDSINVQPPELIKLQKAVAAYNATIAAQATARGYAYADPNALFALLPPGAIPSFPNVISQTGHPVFVASVTATFGTFFSFDGVHPTAASHKLIANALIAAINTKYNTALVAVP